MLKKLFSKFEKNKNNIALIDLDGHEYSYKDIIDKNKYIASKLKKNSLAILICSNSADSIIVYTTLLKFNVLVLLLDESFDKEYIKSVIKKFKPQYIFKPKNFHTRDFTNFESNLISLKSYDIFKTNYKKFSYNKKNYLLLTTSGSTHNPKFVRLSAENIKNNSDSIIDYLKIKKNYATITTMPMGYSYGLSILNTYLEAGAKIILNKDSVFEKNFWEKINKYKINSLNGVPQFYELLKKINFHKFNLKYLKYITQAGGKLDKEVLVYLKDLSKNKLIDLFIMYGQTEASPRMSYLKIDKKNKSKISSIGRSLKNSKFKLIDEKGNNVTKTNKVGEIIYYGKNVCLGYANTRNDLNRGDINKGILLTGDLAYRDKENFYYLVGRKNRISKIFGIRVNLEDIEKKLLKSGIKIKCETDDKFLSILSTKSNDENKIKELIQKNYKINKNYIKFRYCYKINKKNLFKELQEKIR